MGVELLEVIQVFPFRPLRNLAAIPLQLETNPLPSIFSVWTVEGATISSVCDIACATSISCSIGGHRSMLCCLISLMLIERSSVL